jgi:4-hydroxybenzoate polyprenyltransferase
MDLAAHPPDNTGPKTLLRTLLILGRVSNLPTVWSNCLAGWLLSQGGDPITFLLLCAGGTFLYIGGMYLNDAFDAEFDQQHRPERPIPSGAISLAAVWLWGLGWLGAGLVCLVFLGTTSAILALLLTLSILLYDAVHKMFKFSPVLMAACRFFLVLVGASAGAQGVTGPAVWSALVLAAYIVGLTYIARKESLKSALRYWPCLFLVTPLVLSFVVNGGPFLLRGVLMSAIFIGWVFWCLTFAYLPAQRNIGRCVSGLLAGIVIVDFLGAWKADFRIALAFAFLFGLALVFQQFIPAT